MGWRRDSVVGTIEVDKNTWLRLRSAWDAVDERDTASYVLHSEIIAYDVIERPQAPNGYARIRVTTRTGYSAEGWVPSHLLD